MSAPTAPDTPSTRKPARRWRWPRTDSASGVIFHEVIGGLIVYVLVDVLPHVHIAISYHH